MYERTRAGNTSQCTLGDSYAQAYDCAGVVGKLVKGSIDNLNKQISSRRLDRGKGR